MNDFLAKCTIPDMSPYNNNIKVVETLELLLPCQYVFMCVCIYIYIYIHINLGSNFLDILDQVWTVTIATHQLSEACGK